MKFDYGFKTFGFNARARHKSHGVLIENSLYIKVKNLTINGNVTSYFGK